MDERDIKAIEAMDFDLIETVIVSLREIWKKRVLVFLLTIAGFLMALIIVSVKGNSIQYYASATLFSAAYGSYSESNEGVAVMNKYADLIKSSRVCNRAAQSLADYSITAADLKAMVSNGLIKVGGASTKSGSYGYQLRISVYSDSKDAILPITNEMASAFAEELNDLIGSSTIQVMDEATAYAAFETTNVMLWLLAIPGGVFVLTCGVIFLLTFFSPWARSVAQCELDKDMILGLVPYVKIK